MPYCPKCGNEVTGEMQYCPKCGASLRAQAVTRETHEKHEKQEKQEKGEKAEKHEKGETSSYWALIAGLIILAIGAVSLTATFFDIRDPWRGAFFLVAIGIVIIIVAIYGTVTASRRSPRP